MRGSAPREADNGMDIAGCSKAFDAANGTAVLVEVAAVTRITLGWVLDYLYSSHLTFGVRRRVRISLRTFVLQKRLHCACVPKNTSPWFPRY